MRVLAVTNDWPTPHHQGNGAHNRQMLTGLADIGITVDVLFLDRRSAGQRVYLEVAQKIRSTRGMRSFDLVHVTYGGILAERVASTVRDLPTVVSFCGSDLLGENLSGRRRRLIAGCGVIASHRAARLVTGIIVKSQTLCRALPRNIDSTKVSVIPNGVDLRRFKPLERAACCRRLGWDANRFHILFPKNSGDTVKRLDLAQAAVNRVRQLGITCELHLLQGISHADVPFWLNASNALLLTSQHEGSPNVVKEALACNRPVVSVDVGDVAERIGNIQGCYLAAADPDDLANGLLQVRQGPGCIKGRTVARELSLGNISNRIKRCYEEALNRFCQNAIRCNVDLA